MLLSIIIVNYNAAKVLIPCLQSLAAYGDWLKENCEVFMVDNASLDDSVELVKLHFPWVKVIANTENLGFSKANNQGLRLATSDYTLLLNPDTIVPQGTLEACIDFLKNHLNAGVVTCKVELPDRTMDMDCHRGFPTPWASFTYFAGFEKIFPKTKLFGQYHQTWKDLTATHEIDSAVGAFMMMPKKAIDDVGLLDEQFFFYGEDLDWCYRFKEKGYKVYYFPKVKIVHYKGFSSGIRKESREVSSATHQSRRRVALASVEVMKLFYDKHYKHKYPLPVTRIVYFGIWLMRQKRLRA